MDNLDVKLCEWQNAGLLDEAAAERIRQHEATAAGPEREGIRWQALVALSFGAMLLGAGCVLFVAAHWDDLSPLGRFAQILAVIVLFHLGAGWFRERYEAMAIALHAVGTIAAFAGVALVGQIFNIDEHWPTSILLCALCALAGWWLLGDQIQQTLAVLAVPVWLLCEWSDRAEHLRGSDVYSSRMTAMLAITLIVVFLSSRRRVARGILLTVGGIALFCVFPMLSQGWGMPSYDSFRYHRHPEAFLSIGLQGFFWLWMLGLAAFAGWRRRAALLPCAVIFVAIMALPYAHTVHQNAYPETTPDVMAYVITAATAAFLAWWGTQQSSKPLVNYGIVAFALTVMWFFFSDIFNKLDRSFGLMLMGVVFLAGGWLLEKLRRRLVHSITSTEAAA